MDLEDPATRALIRDAPLETAALPGIGGRIRACPSDFVVDEIPAYPPDGIRDRHLLVRIEKEDIDTPLALRLLCEALTLASSEVGVAGRKDRAALTRQWLSLPAKCEPALAHFDHPRLRILEVHPHSQKLRRGHNLGNRFRVVIRDLDVPVEEALRRVEAKRALLSRGILNFFGDQRFGRDGANILAGMTRLREGRHRRPDLFELSAAQSVLFNLYLLRRQREGEVDTLRGGELVKRTDTGGMFTADAPADDQPRLEAGEIEITGPIYGSKMRTPREGSPAAREEAELLSRCGVRMEALRSFGKKLPGTRRSFRAKLVGFRAEEVGAEGDLSEGVALHFALPSGSYATRVVAEVQRGGQSGPVSEKG